MPFLLVAGLAAVIAVIGLGDAGTATTALAALVALMASVVVAALAAHLKARRTLVWSTPLDGVPQLWDEADEAVVSGPRRSPRHAA